MKAFRWSLVALCAALTVSAEQTVDLAGSGGEGYRLELQGEGALTPGSGVLRIAVGAAGAVTGRVLAPFDLEAGWVVLKDGLPWTHTQGDVVQIAAGRASNRAMNCLYDPGTLRGIVVETEDGSTADLRPAGRAFAFRLSAGATLRAVDLWPVFGWRAEAGWPGTSEAGLPRGHIVPRPWLEARRPFPWPTFSPVQLPYLSLSSDEDFPRIREQIDFLARELKDYGFFVFGEWPLTQRYPEYEPVLQAAWIAGNKRACDYAHQQGIRILRWVTDPDILPLWYPELHRDLLARGWFEKGPASRDEWLLDYSNPGVQEWLTAVYTAVGATGADFYWVDNNRPALPVYAPDQPPPVAFRNFYAAIQKGLLASGRQDILIRSGASAWAEYSAVGILDVYAPGPDVQDDWLEQQGYVVNELARHDYLCHYHLWRRCIDDFFPAAPQTIDQTRAMATLLAVTGLGFTTTDIGFPKLPPERLEMLREMLPIVTTRPMSLCRFQGPWPSCWVLNVARGQQEWQVLGVFNWDLREEKTLDLDLADLGLDPAERYLVYDFASQASVGIVTGRLSLRLAPTSGRSLAVHRLAAVPRFISSDRHLTQGAAEIDELAWDAAALRLTGRFLNGVAGRTYHLTCYVPAGLEAVAATVQAADAALAVVGPGLVRFAVSSREAAWQLTCRPARVPAAAPTAPASRPVPTGLHAVRTLGDVAAGKGRGLFLDLGSAPAPAADLIAALRQAVAADGAPLVLVAAAEPKAGARALQEALELRWGLWAPQEGAPWKLLAGEWVPDLDGAPAAAFRTVCVGFRANAFAGLAARCGRGVVAVLAPSVPDAGLAAVGAALATDADGWLGGVRAEHAALRTGAATTLTDITADPDQGVFRGRLALSPLLRTQRLSVHVRREWPCLAGQAYAGVPTVAVLLNDQLLPVIENPCRPYSPPERYDELYHSIPEGVLRGDGSDRIELRMKDRIGRPEQFAEEARTAVELRLESAARVGQTDLAPLPEMALVLDERPFEAALGAGGVAVSVLHARSGVAVVASENATPHGGWPARGRGTTYCLFAKDAFSLQVTLPKTSAGILELLAYDADAYRQQTLAVEGSAEQRLTDFGAGVWVRFPFTAAETADGRLEVKVRNDHGANCVLSGLRLRLEER